MRTKVDWVLVLKGLKAVGVTQPEIAKFCDCAQATVSDIARGDTKDPRFTTGARLLLLAQSHGVKTKTVAIAA